MNKEEYYAAHKEMWLWISRIYKYLTDNSYSGNIEIWELKQHYLDDHEYIYEDCFLCDYAIKETFKNCPGEQCGQIDVLKEDRDCRLCMDEVENFIFCENCIVDDQPGDRDECLGGRYSRIYRSYNYYDSHIISLEIANLPLRED